MMSGMRITARLAMALSAAATVVLLMSDHFQMRGPLRLLVVAITIAWVSLLIVYWNIAVPLERLAQWMARLGTGDAPALPRFAPLAPLVAEATRLVQRLSEAKAEAALEARLRQSNDAVWTPERLKQHASMQLGGRPLFVVANREPYEHMRKGGDIVVRTPASGLVTGIEPVLRACGGVWVAHGSGNADWETADERGRIAVPPGEPQYALRRVKLTSAEEDGYYYGFSNEGLWPLCHIAHTRPLFEAADWAQYQAVNEKFAEAVLDEMKGTEEPCVLIQDYHFALLPRLIKKARPDARVGLFWHIPWPNPETFGICPWQREILDGMLGADLLGFHIQYHCNNFLETVDRALEARVDWDRFAVRRLGSETLIKPLPISIAFPPAPAPANLPGKSELLSGLGVHGDFMLVGVDRVDYTKGLTERFRAVESLLDSRPEYQGRLVFVELGAPSRTLIPRYHDLMEQVEAEVARINARFQTKQWRPIVFLKGHHSHAEILPYYKAADACMVTSLHDGMNLVAKEYVAARDDERGALILSRFTGAVLELRDALVINPYDTEQMAQAIHAALTMTQGEQARRMSAMRRVLSERNVYFWGARLIEELARVPLTDANVP
jgi:trehalose 6-phosphate synthase